MTIQWRTSATTAVGASPRSVSSTGVVSGDYVFLHVLLADDIAPSVLPSGFVLVPGAEITGTNNNRIYMKVAGGSEPATYDVEFASGNGQIGIAAMYSDVPKDLVIDDVQVRTNASSTNRTFAEVTALNDNSWMLMFGSFAGSSGTTAPGSATERYDVGTSPRIYLMTEALTAFGQSGTRNGTGIGLAQKNISISLAEPSDGAAIRGITTASQSSTDSRSVAMPPRTVEDDLILIATMSNHADAPTMPGGFSLVDGVAVANGIRIYKKRAGSGEAGPYTVDFPAGATVNNVAAISFYAHEGHLVDVDQSADQTTTGSSNLNFAEVDPTVQPGLLLGFASRNSGTGITPDGTMDELWDSGANLKNFLMVATYAALTATGTKTATTGISADGFSVLLNVAEASNPPPAAPSLLVATTVNQTRIDLGFSDNSTDETSFEIERSLDGSTGWTNVGSNGPGDTTFSDLTVVANTQYYYRVYAVGPGGNSDYSNVDDATTLPNAPTAPSGLTATGFSQTQINLDWTDNSDNEDEFEIERSDNGSTGWTQIATTAAGDSDYENTGLTPDTTYYYRVRAVNTGGNSSYTTVESATTHPAFLAPENLTATALTARMVRLTWEHDSEYESGYEIERSLNGVSGWTVIATLGINETQYDDVNLIPNTDYYYRIRAYQD